MLTYGLKHCALLSRPLPTCDALCTKWKLKHHITTMAHTLEDPKDVRDMIIQETDDAEAENTRDLILDTQRPVDIFQKRVEALRRSVKDVSDVDAVLIEIFIHNRWHIPRLYTRYGLDLFLGFPRWFIDHKIQACYSRASGPYRFHLDGNVVTSAGQAYGDLEKCDRVAYKSTFELGFLAGILNLFLVIVLVAFFSRRRLHQRTLFLALSISVACFSAIYFQV